MTEIQSWFTEIQCSNCGKQYDADQLLNTCDACGKVLFARYDLEGAATTLTKESLKSRPWNLWRYAEIMPVRSAEHRLTLGEGGTPLLNAPRLGANLGLTNLLIKDEGRNPTGSFKARGLGAAVARARELGVTAIALPSAGNAAAAASAYLARGGMQAYVFMPQDTPAIFMAECRALGAKVFLVDGLINDAGAIVKAHAEDRGWFDVSTLKEPYRAEGKKTMGLELAEQLDWKLPDVILYPTGGGTGIVGMWKAFDELEQMGFIGSERPRMYAVQSEGCAPIVRAWEAGSRSAELFENAATIAPGIRVPIAIGDYLIIDALTESGGKAIAVTDSEILDYTNRASSLEGIHLSPEVGALFAAAAQLRASGDIAEHEQVVAFGTGSGLKHTDLVETGYPLLHPGDPGNAAIIDGHYVD